MHCSVGTTAGNLVYIRVKKVGRQPNPNDFVKFGV